MTKKRILWISLAALVVLIVVAMVMKGGKKDLEVETAKVESRTITEIVSVTGKIQPESEVKISADVSGEIIDMMVHEGDSVTKGQLLLKANLDNARAALAGAEAQSIKAKSSFDQAGLNYKRQKKLYDQKVISDQEWENAQLQYEVAKADFEAAGKSVLGSKYNVQSVAARLEEGKRNLGRTSIYAPASGIVTHLTSEKGERVVGTAQMAGTEIMRISNMHMMEVQVNVNENDIVRIHRGDSADVKVDAYDGRIFRGVVTEIANSAVFNAAQNMSDQVTNFVVKIRLVPSSYQDLTAEGEFPFLPGMTASVDVKTKTKTGVVSVPIAAVTTRNPMGASKDGKAAESKSDVQTWVFLYNGGKAKAVEVKTGVQDLDFYEVLGGLKVGDEVVSGPSMSVAKTLNDGDKLKKKK
jgi:HlyD family secretion protein